jgi:hypothetical protein
MKYWLGKNGQQLGPYELADLQKMLAEGGIGPGDLAWTQGMAAWAPALEVIKPLDAPLAPTIPMIPPAATAQPQPAATREPAPQAPAAQPIASAQASAPAPAPVAAPQPYAPAQPYVPPAAQPASSFGQQPPYSQPYPYGQPQPWGQQPYPGAPLPPQAAMMGPVPPAMHWVLVWVIGAFTFGLFILYWIFKQANFVLTIDPQSKARTLYLAGIGLEVVYVLLVIAGVAMSGTNSTLGPALMGIGGICMLAAVVCIIMGHFSIRASMLKYYNTVENIGLRLSGVMTFFFNILYFQHHFTRIAEWKRTGVLTPQK